VNEAPPKFLVVDDVPENFAEVEQDVDVVPVGEFTLKGLGRPVTAFDIVAVRSAAPEPSRR
jgi:hypothetical protein